MTINLQINQAKRNIADAINNSNLPISIIRMIVDDIAEEVREAEYKALQQEAEEEQIEREKANIGDEKANIEVEKEEVKEMEDNKENE